MAIMKSIDQGRRELVGTVHQRVHQWTLRVSLAARVATLTTLAVALTLGSVSASVYLVVRAELVGNLDASIRARAEQAVGSGYTPSSITDRDADLLDVAGIEMPEEYRGIGVRIEDNILVTESGAENLSIGIPRTADDVEAWLRG